MLKTVLTTLGVLKATAVAKDRLSAANRTALQAYLCECDDLQPGVSTFILDYLLTGQNESLLQVCSLPGRELRLTGYYLMWHMSGSRAARFETRRPGPAMLRGHCKFGYQRGRGRVHQL